MGGCTPQAARARQCGYTALCGNNSAICAETALKIDGVDAGVLRESGGMAEIGWRRGRDWILVCHRAGAGESLRPTRRRRLLLLGLLLRGRLLSLRCLLLLGCCHCRSLLVIRTPRARCL